MPYFKLLEELHSLRSIEKIIQKELKCAPEGSLYVSSSHGHVQFCQIIPGQKRRYLGTHSTPLIQALAQKYYNQRLLKAVKKDLTALESLMNSKYGNPVEELSVEEETSLYNEKAVYLKIRPEIRQLVTPHALTIDDLTRQWEAQAHPRSWINQEECVFATEKGDLVRSKSEVIIADKLFRAGIPYRYEQPLEIGSRTLHPDFTVLDKHTKEEFIWEHFGMMDDPLYMERALHKIDAYAEHGYVLGAKLIATFESRMVPLNIRTVDAIINRLK